MSRKTVTNRPQLKSSQNSIRVCHKELLTAVENTNDGFGLNVTSAINPGLPGSFPWLSVIAQRFEKYKFLKLKYFYIARCATTNSGSVLMAVDYDPADKAPRSEEQMSSYQGCSSDVVWRDVVLDAGALIDKSKFYFIRSSDLAANLDIKTYDVGNFYLATDSPFAFPGKVWVEYECELSIPHIEHMADIEVDTHVQLSNSVATTGVAQTIWLGLLYESPWVNAYQKLINRGMSGALLQPVVDGISGELRENHLYLTEKGNYRISGIIQSDTGTTFELVEFSLNGNTASGFEVLYSAESVDYTFCMYQGYITITDLELIPPGVDENPPGNKKGAWLAPTLTFTSVIPTDKAIVRMTLWVEDYVEQTDAATFDYEKFTELLD